MALHCATCVLNTLSCSISLNSDSDGDGLEDGQEDSDNDGLTDVSEVDTYGRWLCIWISHLFCRMAKFFCQVY